jgi:CheY-like chemotaxis protein
MRPLKWRSQADIPSVRQLPAESTGRIRVLVADDSDIFRQTVCELMEMVGGPGMRPCGCCSLENPSAHTWVQPVIDIVGGAGDGLEVIEAVAALQPDLVIMEVHLPYLDGLKASTVIARYYPDVQIMLMSADDSPKTREQGRIHGAHAFVPKDELIVGMHQALEELFPSVFQITAKPA